MSVVGRLDLAEDKGLVIERSAVCVGRPVPVQRPSEGTGLAKHQKVGLKLVRVVRGPCGAEAREIVCLHRSLGGVIVGGE
jgi:hypothetical protein